MESPATAEPPLVAVMAGEGAAAAPVEVVWAQVGQTHKSSRKIPGNPVLLKTAPGRSLKRTRNDCFEAARKVPAHLDAEGPKKLPERVINCLARAQENSSLAGVQYKHSSAITYFPSLDSA